MNKNAIKKLMIAAIACIALCGTALAAPRVAAPDGRPAVGGYPAPHKAPGAKPMPKHAPQVAHHRAPVRHAPPRRPTTPCHRHHRHECHDCHYDHNGWVELGAGIIGGIIGALIAG